MSSPDLHLLDNPKPPPRLALVHPAADALAGLCFPVKAGARGTRP